MKTSNKGKTEAARKLADKTVSVDKKAAPKNELSAAKPAAKAKKPTAAKTRSLSAVKLEAKSPARAASGKKKAVLKKPVVPSSPAKKMLKAEPAPVLEAAVPVPGIDKTSDPLASLSPVDRLLAQPELPPLERENRARLQMQTPTRLYFYWSVRENPWALLRKAFRDDTGSYTLVLKLVELRSGAEQIYNAEAEGNWWFDVRPDGEYQAEIGFYAPNRPYFRIVYSNTVETPRLKPSPRKASEAKWTVTADKFARVLDVAGFTRDAVDVAVAGDDIPAADAAARQALDQFMGVSGEVPVGIEDDDIRYALLEIAAGQKLDDLRWKISAELFAYMQAGDKHLDRKRAQDALSENFDIDEFETEEFGPAVFGASLVNFPRTMKSRRSQRGSGPGYQPDSSHSYRQTFGQK